MTAASGRHRLKVNLTEKLSMLFHAPSMHLACSTAAENAAPGSKTLPVPNGSGWDLKTLHPPKLLESIHTEMSLWSAYVAYAYKQTHQHTAGICRTNCVAIASVLSTHKRSGPNSTLHKTSTNHAKKQSPYLWITCPHPQSLDDTWYCTSICWLNLFIICHVLWWVRVKRRELLTW